MTLGSAVKNTGISLENGLATKIARWLCQKSKKQRLVIAFIAGIFATLSLPPIYFIPALYISFPILCWLLIDVRTKRQAFFMGWFFSFGYLAASLYWISFALLVYSDRMWWVIPFASLGLPAALAIYGGLATLGASYAKTGIGRAIALALLWWLADWLRGTLFTGFPWNLVGQSWAGSETLIQIVSVIGIYGVSLLALLSCVLLAALPYVAGSRKLILVGVIIILPLGSFVFGSIRLADAPKIQEASGGDGVGIRLVQANILQREKWQHDFQLRNFETYLNFSQIDKPDWVKLVIWPETAASFYLEDAEVALGRIMGVLKPDEFLITGAPRREVQGDDYQIYNGAVVINSKGRVVNSYNKFHLVPFGEYMPFKDILMIDKITPGKKDYSAGVGPRTINVDKTIPAFSPLVCYEAIFSGSVTNEIQPPDWILNLTNDAWYGETAGPHQHADLTRMRAIEEGMPLVRSASTGISVVFDSYGRQVAKIGLGETGVLDFRLPSKLIGKTVFSQYKHYIAWTFFFIVLLVLVLIERIAKR